MESNYDKHSKLLALIDQLKPYAPDADTHARVRVDFMDLADICQWFLDEIAKHAGSTLSQDQLEEFLIEIDVNFIQHIEFHLRSLQKTLPRILEKFPNEEPPSVAF